MQTQASSPFPVLAVLCLFALAPPLSLAAQEQGSPARVPLSGQVIDHSSGQPIPYATVQIQALRVGVLSDSLGHFRIPSVPLGHHVVTAGQLGFVGAEVEWEIVPENPPMLVQLIASPVVLEGVETTVDRLQSRRRAYPRSVRVLDRARLADAIGQNAMETVRGRAGLTLMPCPGAANLDCILHRGRPVRPAVYVDEGFAWDGLQALASLQPHELHAIEVFGNGLQIRAYTVWFMEGMGRRPRVLQQIPIH